MSDRWLPRTVLMTADTMGGVWSYSLALAEALATRGVQVLLATMGDPLRPEQRAAARHVRSLEIFESRFALEWMDDPWDDVARAGEWLLELERWLAPDVVHLNGYAHARLPWRAPTVVVAHSCVSSWWRAVFGTEAPLRYARYRSEVAAGLAAAHAVVAPTEAMARALVAEHATTRAIRVVSNAVDASHLEPGPKEPLVLAAGRAWDLAKNVSALDAAASRVPWPVVVAGSYEGPDGATAPPRTARALGWLDRSALAEWMSRAAIFASPARYEPFGLCALEAALSGCALVLGDIPSQREVWGDAAIFASPDDPVALGEAITSLAHDERARERMAARARARARAYTPERMRAGYLSIYREARRQATDERTRPCA